MKRTMIILACIASIAATAAFTKPDKPRKPKAELSKKKPSASTWYIFKLFCGSTKYVHSLSEYRDPHNYRLMGGTQDSAAALCQGNESDPCVCAIWTDSWIGHPGLPNIGSSSTIYTKLYDWYTFDSALGGFILFKIPQ